MFNLTEVNKQHIIIKKKWNDHNFFLIIINFILFKYNIKILLLNIIIISFITYSYNYENKYLKFYSIKCYNNKNNI